MTGPGGDEGQTAPISMLERVSHLPYYGSAVSQHSLWVGRPPLSPSDSSPRAPVGLPDHTTCPGGWRQAPWAVTIAVTCSHSDSPLGCCSDVTSVFSGRLKTLKGLFNKNSGWT